jgi:hypothetical protein
MKTRLTLWERLKPKYKKAINAKFSNYPHSHAAIVELLNESNFFTTVPYGVAFDVMAACNLSFFGDAFNPNPDE